MTVRANKPALNLREEIAKAQSNNAEEARIGSLVSDSIDAVAIDVEQFTSTGIDDNATSTAVTINSSGNLGIGTVAPSQLLHVQGANQGIRLTDTTGSSDFHEVQSGGVNGQNLFIDADRNSLGGVMIFRVNGSIERARIDDSGNLLVGKTVADTETVGVRLGPTGFLSGSVEGNPVAYLNRRTSDGSIVEIRKDGTTVGSIATYGGALLVDHNTMTVASLPAASGVSGARAMVSDSTVAGSGNFGATVAGGGSNVVPVYSDGTNWKIG